MSNFSRENFKVVACSDHVAALSRFGEIKPDLIILEEGLSVDSFEACSQLRRAVDIPIVISGKVPGGTAWAKAVESGADLYFSKALLLFRVSRQGEGSPAPL
jgi:DNA-binding response OmpR family regulator